MAFAISAAFAKTAAAEDADPAGVRPAVQVEPAGGSRLPAPILLSVEIVPDPPKAATAPCDGRADASSCEATPPATSSMR